MSRECRRWARQAERKEAMIVAAKERFILRIAKSQTESSSTVALS